MNPCWIRFAQIAGLRRCCESTTELRSLETYNYSLKAPHLLVGVLVEDIEPAAVAPYIERSSHTGIGTPGKANNWPVQAVKR